MQNFSSDSDEVEMIAPGNYFLKNGKHYVVYDELAEGFEGSIHNTIRITPELVDIRKSGLVTAHMAFAPGQAEETRYETPMGEMVIGTLTEGVDLSEEEDSLVAKVRYALDINYEHVSDCNIEISIMSRDKVKPGLLS